MEDLANKTDAAIAKIFNESGDKQAYLEIYNRYHAQLYSSARKRGISGEIAEEIVQDLFINLWQQRTVININSSLSGYLFTAIRNLVLNQIQKDSVRLLFQDSLKVYQTDYDNSTEEYLLANDLHQSISKNMLALPEKCRSVFELSRKHHKSNKEIAIELGISEKTVENHITRAIKYLKLCIPHTIVPFLVMLFDKVIQK